MKGLKKYFKTPSRETIIVYSVGISVLAAVFIAFYFTVGKTLRSFVGDVDTFKLWLDSYENLSALMFVFIRAFQTVIKIIPAEPLEIASGYVFGAVMGTVYCSLGSLIGSAVIVALSKWLGGRFISAFINEEQINELSVLSSRENQRLFLIVFYLIPGTPKDLFTYAVGSTKINIFEFFAITTICRLPSIVTSTLCGAQIECKNYTSAIVIFILTAAASVICGWLYKKQIETRNKKSF